MPYTRRQIERVLIKRTGQFLSEAGLDGTTQSGANDDLSDPIATTIRKMGYTVADLSEVADTDLANVPDGDIDQLLDMAELRVLETIEGNLTLVTTGEADSSYSFSDLASRLSTRIQRLRDRIIEEYGVISGVEIGTGVIVVSSRPGEPEL